jgi:hypothetical protein
MGIRRCCHGSWSMRIASCMSGTWEYLLSQNQPSTSQLTVIPGQLRHSNCDPKSMPKTEMSTLSSPWGTFLRRRTTCQGQQLGYLLSDCRVERSSSQPQTQKSGAFKFTLIITSAHPNAVIAHIFLFPPTTDCPRTRDIYMRSSHH